MAITVQNLLDRIVSLIGRNTGEDPSDTEILFYMDAALKQLQAAQNWPNLRVVSSVVVPLGATTSRVSNNVLKKINSITYLDGTARVVMNAADPTQWAVNLINPAAYTLADIHTVMFDTPFKAETAIVVDRYEYLPLPALGESNNLIDTAPLLVIAQTMLNLSPKLRLEASDAAIYRSQVQDAYNALNRWNASILGSK